ncbi:MAG: DNA polymerase Y family protein [Phycisphaerales bacterium]|nr:DNA polymerase Y family protein [Phycisphaerales bacterium]
MLSIDLLRRRDDRRSTSPDDPRGRRHDASPDPKPAHDRRPILIVDQIGQQRVVVACCERATRAGVRRGIPAAQARAAFPVGAVRLEEAAPRRDRAALDALAVWAHQFSPTVAPDPPDGLLLDVTGCERVFRGEDRLLGLVQERCRAKGLRARGAIAPSFGCAWAVARFGKEALTVVAEQEERHALKPLPVRALRVDDDAVEALAEVGITRIGELFDLPRAVLPSRFGADLLFRLDQALARAIETIEPVRPITPPSAERVFDGPTTNLEAVGWCVRMLLDELGAELLHRESGARRLDLTLGRSDMEPARLMVSMSRPNRDARHLWSLIEPRLARTHMGFGIDRVAIVASRLGRLEHTQATHLHERQGVSESEAARLGAELTDTMANRFGPIRVVQAMLVASHIPERAAAWRVVGSVARPSVARFSEPCGDSRLGEPYHQDSRLGEPCHPETNHPDRPPVLLDRPEPIDVIALTPDGPVAQARWRGEDHPVTACLGPERIAPEWWRDAQPTRDYFRIQTEGGQWLWLFRELETGRWFVQGGW